MFIKVELNKESKELFYIEEVKTLKNCNIYVNFYSRRGEVNVCIQEKPEFGNNIISPNSTNYNYKRKQNYIRKE